MDVVATKEQDNVALMQGKQCITEFTALCTALVDKDVHSIELRKSFTDIYFTPSWLGSFVQSAQELRPDVEFVVEDCLHVSDINRVRDLNNINDLEELIYVFESRPKEMFELLHMLCNRYINGYSETLLANNKLASLHLQNTQLNREKESLEHELCNERESRREYETKLKTIVSRINYNYQKDIDADTLLVSDTCGYDKILYIKEITRVKYVDTFIYYLQEIIRTLYGVPARVVVIEPPYANVREDLYPLYKSYERLTYNDVYKEDIFMAGFQTRLMENILADASNANYLIILDRSGYKNPYVHGKRVEYLFTVSDVHDLHNTQIPAKRIISYSDKTLYIPYIAEFENLTIEERIGRYSSMTCMQSILNLLERRN